MSDHLTEAARHLRAALDHLTLHDVDDVATQQATIDMMGELHRTRLFYVMKGLEKVKAADVAQGFRAWGETSEEFAERVGSAVRAYATRLGDQ